MDLQQQYATITLMLLSGALMGAIYDVYRTSVKEWRFLRRFSALWDILFWLLATVFVFTMLLGANHGEVRPVVFLLLGAGWWLYALTLRILVVAVTTQVIRGILAVLRFFAGLFRILVITPLRFLFQLLWVIAGHINRLMERTEIILVWPIAWSGRRVIRFFDKKEDGEDETNK